MTGPQLLVVVLAGVVTYAIRASFLLYAGRMAQPPERVTTVLRMIPPAALAALAVPGLLRPDHGALDPVNPVLLGGIVAALVSLWRGSIALSLAAGLGAVMLAQPLLG